MINVQIWLPPEEDHADWQALTGETISREEFERLASEALRTVLAEGNSAVFVEKTVDWMRGQLSGKTNTPAARAEAIAKLVASQTDGLKTVWGIKINAGSIVWAALGPKIDSQETPVNGNLAEAVRRILRAAEEKE